MLAQRMLPNWLEAWLKIFDQTNIPAPYVLWAGIFAIGAALQNKVYFDRGLRKIYPNLYVWIIGPPATGKSIPAETAANMLRNLPNANVHSGELTKSYLLKYLQSCCLQQRLEDKMVDEKGKEINVRRIVSPSVILHSDELAAGVGSGELAIDLLKHLVQMYTVPEHYDYGTVAHSGIFIENPLINWIACSTQSWLQRAVPKDLFDSGLIARVNTITAQFPSRPPRDVKIDESEIKALIHDLLFISTFSGQFHFSPEAEQLRLKTVDELHDKRRKMNEDIVQALYGREEDQAIKVSMILSASVRNDLLITEDIYNSALRFVSEARETSLHLYIQSAAAPKTQIKSYVLRAVERRGMITRRTLLQALSWRASSVEIDQALADLEDEGKIVCQNAVIKDPNSGKSRMEKLIETSESFNQRKKGGNGNGSC